MVKSGAGDGQGFASCAEMEFYRYDDDKFRYETLFTDSSCSELKPGVTMKEIEECKSLFFKNIATYLFKGDYPKEFRIAEYRAYPRPEIKAKEAKTHPYGLYDNVTGICVEENDDLVVLAGDLHGREVSIVVQNLDKPGGDGFYQTSNYPLSKGINKFKMNRKGLIYVMYHTPDFKTAPPVKIHFAGGRVNGYFDISKHKREEWNARLAKADFKYFDILGEFCHIVFPTAKYRENTKNGFDLAAAYDRIIKNEWELLGLYKYDRTFDNRMRLSVMYHSYMYATSFYTGYNETTLGDLCNESKVISSSCWGPAHEIGHCNQTRPGLKWHGTTEVTTNIMSQYIQTAVFGQESRLQSEDMGEGLPNRYAKAWNNIIVQGQSHAAEGDVFCKLVPFWQLQLYFGEVLGRTPLKQNDKGGFYPELFELIRKEKDLPSAGEQQSEFVLSACRVAKMDLTDFFEKWGYLKPVDIEIDDYGKATLRLTEQRANEIRQKVRDLSYPKPDVALEYISDINKEYFKTKDKVVPGQSRKDGNTFTMTGWKNVVAYEVRDEADNMVFVSEGKRKVSDVAKFTVSKGWKDGYKLYAISATRERTLVKFN